MEVTTGVCIPISGWVPVEVLVDLKLCSKCRIPKPLGEYSRGAGRDGLFSYCKACAKVYSAARYAADPEKAKLVNAAWRAAHPEEEKARKADWYAAHREESLAANAVWRAAHPEELKAKEAARYAVDPEKARVRNAVWRAAHPEEVKAAKAIWRAAHCEEEKAAKAIWRAAHREEEKARKADWYAAHREEEKAQAKARYAANPEKAKAVNTAWYATHLEETKGKRKARYAAHREEMKATNKGWYAAHPEQARVIASRRRARKLGNVAEFYDRAKIFERDEWTCQLCWLPVDPELKHPNPGCRTIDHIIPLFLGGSDTEDNVQLAHFSCNCSKVRSPEPSVVPMNFNYYPVTFDTSLPVETYEA